jgi:hypothetical protein
VLSHEDFDIKVLGENQWYPSNSFHGTVLGAAHKENLTEIFNLLLAHRATNDPVNSIQAPLPSEHTGNPEGTNEASAIEMEEPNDLNSDSDPEEQPFSFWDEYTNTDELIYDAPLTIPEDSQLATESTQDWMNTVLS